MCIRDRVEGIHFTRENCVLSAGHFGRLAYIGLPMGFEYSVSAIGAFIMQDAINLPVSYTHLCRQIG